MPRDYLFRRVKNDEAGDAVELRVSQDEVAKDPRLVFTMTADIVGGTTVASLSSDDVAELYQALGRWLGGV